MFTDAHGSETPVPIVFVPRLLFRLVSLALLAAGVWLVWRWWEGYDAVLASGAVRHETGPDLWLWAGLALLAWSLGLGRLVVLLLLRPGSTPPTARAPGRTVEAPDGSALHVEISGVASGPTVILTHGWGLNSTAWGETRRALSARFRVVTWDLPGLGRSTGPKDGRYEIDRFAQALGAVVESCGPEPVVLVGHSIGGMTTQTLFRAAPAAAARVAGVVLVDTTHEDPTRTMWLSPLWRALKGPVLTPLMHLTIWLTPLAWLSSWQGYLSGSDQLVMRLTGFGRFATRGQVDLTARLACKGSPGVQAKGNLAMFRWRATEVLPRITAPVLVIGGGRDIVTLPRASREIAAAIPNARLFEAAGAGHMGFMEAADVYNAEIAAFVEEVCAERRAA